MNKIPQIYFILVNTSSSGGSITFATNFSAHDFAIYDRLHGTHNETSRRQTHKRELPYQQQHRPTAQPTVK